MVKGNTDSEKIKKTDETKNFILEVIKHNKMMKKKHKRMCRTLN